MLLLFHCTNDSREVGNLNPRQRGNYGVRFLLRVRFLLAAEDGIPRGPRPSKLHPNGPTLYYSRSLLCQWDDKTVRERSDRPPSTAEGPESKKITS